MRSGTFTQALIASFLLAIPAAADMPSVVSTVAGRADIIDGDSLRVANVEIRLQGVSAPEVRGAEAPLGRQAERALEQITSGGTVRCDLDGTSAGYGRKAAVCYVDGQDIGAILIRSGYARDCPRYSGGRYRELEDAARRDGRDLSSVYRLPGYC